MNDLAQLLFHKPAPIPRNSAFVRKVSGDVYARLDAEQPAERIPDDEHLCGSCGGYFPPEGMHHRLDGKLGSRCKKCYARNQIRRAEREEIVEPDKTARRIAKASGMMIIEKFNRFYVYRKTSPKPTFCGSRSTGNALLVFVKKLALCK